MINQSKLEVDLKGKIVDDPLKMSFKELRLLNSREHCKNFGLPSPNNQSLAKLHVSLETNRNEIDEREKNTYL